MNIVLRILIGLALAGTGSWFVIKTRDVMGFFGPVDWAEAKLGGGGSYLLYKGVGILLCFIGIIVAANLWDWFLQSTLGSIFPRADAGDL